MRVQHNIAATNAYRNYSSNTKAIAKNLEKLSSGYRINRAGDDAAGLAISEKMRAQITGLNVAQKNAKDGISLVQTAEGALTEVHSMLNRMFSLSEQSANGTYDNAVDRANLQKEFSALRTEIDRIADSSNFNGQKLLDGALGARTATVSAAVTNGVKSVEFMGGGTVQPATAINFAANVDAAGKVSLATPATGVTWEAVASDTISGTNGGTITFQAKVDRTNTSALSTDLDFYDGMTASVTVDSANGAGAYVPGAVTTTVIGAAKGLSLQIGDTAESFNKLTVSVGDMHSTALSLDDLNIGSQEGASSAMASIKTAINSVSSTRGDLGALQNRLDHTINNLGVMEENIQDAESTVRDTDVAQEMMAYTKNNILVQSAQAMLAQANQLPQGVLQLLG